MTAHAATTAADPPRATPAPGALAEAIGRGMRRMRRWTHRVRSALGVRRGQKVRGVYYKELTAESLQRALSKKGRGWKDYRVTFPDGAKLVIRASAARVYDDLMDPLGYDAGQELLSPLLEIIRPGSRLLAVRAGTGAAGSWLGAAVGASGAVVALEEDEQSVAYATRRYPRGNVSFERASIEGLTGEINGSFDGAAVVRPLTGDEPQRFLAELWRVVAPGGWMMVPCAAGQGEAMATAVRALPGAEAAGVRRGIGPGSRGGGGSAEGAGGAGGAGGGLDLVFASKVGDDAPPEPRRSAGDKPGRPPEAGETARS